MEESSKQISTRLDEIINNNLLISEELRTMFRSFKEVKTEYPFGSLCLMHYQDYSTTFNEEIYTVAAAIELIILSFDIIDDLQDQDSDYIWTKTPALSLNVVLSMLTLAQRLIRESTFEYRYAALNIIEEYTLTSINGQHLDILNLCKDEASYLQMIEQKSGSLTAMSAIVGFIMATGNESSEVAQYSKALGVIQQIKNDIQSLKVWNNKNDLLNKKFSLPIIYLLSLQNDTSIEIKKYYKNMTRELSQYNINSNLLNSGAIHYALAIKNVYRNKASNIIHHTNLNNKNKDYLKNIMK
ncbi:polyprenyl synthetase family protein [Solibacillus sp. CAU 1738]|uniref:polyprenyl synthetase family protein n=1 Tax=Solibacillus sp. CAU 1738 TaxID=3140363 RepID=UPI003260FCB3